MKNALELQNVSKSFKGFEMKDMTFSLPEGCILGLVGKNGAGKSTTIHLIMDMIHKDSGTIYVLGKNIEEDFTETKQDIGVVLDEPSFPEYVTADQMNNIMKNIYRNWDEKRYYELIDRSGFRLLHKMELSRRWRCLRRTRLFHVGLFQKTAP